MKAFNNFSRELKELVEFHKLTLYAYDETESLLCFWRKNKLSFNKPSEFGHTVIQPKHFATKRSKKKRRRKSLNEIIFVRLISALEVFLVDIVRDAFLQTKEPFKKQDLKFQLSHAKILSIKSTSNFYNKIINKECRKLSSSGFNEIIKYYKKHFNINMVGFSPGKNKMEEYHARRNLLVHKLGRTDSYYRTKYNTAKLSLTIDNKYLLECIDELNSFCGMVNNQMEYQLKNEFIPSKSKRKVAERKMTLMVKFESESQRLEYFQPDYEFWAQDEFSVFGDILDSEKDIDSMTKEYKISGTFAQIRSFTRILNGRQKEEKFKINVTMKKIKSGEKYIRRMLDEEVLKQIEEKLPKQPWETGIHKIIASELEIPNKLVSTAIQLLIVKGIFKQQIDGKIID